MSETPNGAQPQGQIRISVRILFGSVTVSLHVPHSNSQEAQVQPLTAESHGKKWNSASRTKT